MLRLTERGLFCAAGGFYIDPPRAVERALITHAHSDHARAGSAAYLCAAEGVGVLRQRLGRKANITGLPYDQPQSVGDVRVSFHPAGHVLGSAQIRVEHRGEVWVVSGDYKVEPDPTCTPFVPVRCHTFVTEATFALPIYRWPAPEQVREEILDWWRANQRAGRMSLLLGYSLGKAQRLLAGLDPAVGPILAHDSVRAFLPAYAAAGRPLPDVQDLSPEQLWAARGRGLVIAPPAASGAEDWARLGPVATAVASGWMLLRRHRTAGTRGFVVSDHADWAGLIGAVRATGATRVLAMHGTTGPLVRWLRENGWEAAPLEARAHRP